MLPTIDADSRSDAGRRKTIARDLRWPGPAVSPGEMLREEFLQPLGISPTEAARRMEISARRLNEVVRGKRRVTVDTALRLSRLLKTSLSSGRAFRRTGTCTGRPIGSRRERSKTPPGSSAQSRLAMLPEQTCGDHGSLRRSAN